MSTLHVVEPGCTVRREMGRLIVVREGRTLAHARLRELEHVLLGTGVQVTTQALAACVGHGVRVCLVGRSRVVAALEPDHASNVATRIAQVDRLRDAAYRVAFVRALVGAKLGAQASLVRRWRDASRDPDLRAALGRSAEGLERAVARAESMGAELDVPTGASEQPALDDELAPTDPVEALRGCEGSGAARYFEGLRAQIGGAFGFAARRMHPPPDPVNAALSYAYAILSAEIGGQITACGLDTGIGMLHGLRSGRESLVLDAMEPYRPLCADLLVTRLIGRSELREEHFEPYEERAVHLTAEGRRVFLRRWEQWVDAPGRGEAVFGLQPPASAPKDAWRQAFRAQAVAIRHAILCKELPRFYHDQPVGPEAGRVIRVAKGDHPDLDEL